MTDAWANLEKRDVEQVEFEAMLAAQPIPDPTDPGQIAVMFIAALDERGTRLDDLRFLVTPESLDSWGDFADAGALLDSIEDWGVGSKPSPAEGSPDVAYASILRGVRQSFQITSTGDQIVAGAAVLTLVWRPEFGRWMVHAIGEYVRPELVPRTAGLQ